MKSSSKSFKDYWEAYKLYSDINSGRDTDRKDASIVMSPTYEYLVVWNKKE